MGLGYRPKAGAPPDIAADSARSERVRLRNERSRSRTAMTDFDVVVGHGAGTLAAIQGGGAGGTKSAPQTPARARLAALNAAVATGRSTLRTSAPVGGWNQRVFWSVFGHRAD